MEMNAMEETKKPRVDDHEGSNTKLQHLPQPIIHHIMHLLLCKDATKLSALSKDFYSHWISFPVLDFNYDFFQPKDNSDETFFTYIQRIIELRGPHIKDTLQKLNFTYHGEIKPTNPHLYRTAFDALLDFVMESNCKEITFDLRITVPYRFILQGKSIINQIVSYDKFVPLFSSMFLTVLKLTGLRFSPIVDAFITCPMLQELLINSCEGFHTIVVSCPSIKKVEVKFCLGLGAFQVEGEKLESFIFEGIRIYNTGLQPCDVHLPVCDSLRYLHLSKVKVLTDYLNEVATEFLYLGRCDLSVNLQIYNPHIRVLEMECNNKVENLVLNTPNLESFKFTAFERQACTLNILACLALRILKLRDVITITDEWVKNVLLRLVCLEDVELLNCIMLQQIILKTEILKKFSLYGCLDLRELVLETPNLVEFNYIGSLGIYVQILSGKCSGNIRLSRNTSDHLLWFENMTEFLRSFDHFKNITFTCSTTEDMIFPREFVWLNKIPPLYDVKHIRFQAENIPSNEVVTRLVECLLWFVPKPLTLTLSSNSSGKTGTLKFGYVRRRVEERGSEQCCSSLPIKCWKHFVLKVQYEGFDDEEPMTQCLEKFFAPYMRY
ncbi:hypothetical protein QN277_025086 [Acacia crassicarpa]|nr:hypothetical protein QN277_025086 [Acacia crassicarpa]